jgi:NAD(P)-dependent dehydrogenase (short-subunit alcohol dehydrogenase family)
MTGELVGRTAVVTGASRGIGISEGVRRRALEDERNAARTGVPAARAVEELIGEAISVLSGAGL